jgi:hypothetical protein
MSCENHYRPVVGAFTSTSTILVLFILLVIVTRSWMPGV